MSPLTVYSLLLHFSLPLIQNISQEWMSRRSVVSALAGVFPGTLELDRFSYHRASFLITAPNFSCVAMCTCNLTLWALPGVSHTYDNGLSLSRLFSPTSFCA